MKKMMVSGLLMLSAFGVVSAISQTSSYLSNNSQETTENFVVSHHNTKTVKTSEKVLGIVHTAFVVDDGTGGAAPCVISGINAPDVISGQTTSITFNDSGCSVAGITGGGFFNQYIAPGYSFVTNAINQDTSFTISAYDQANNVVSQSFVVHALAPCQINSFSGNNTNTGTPGTISYSITSGCTAALNTGGGFNNQSVSLTGNTFTTNPIYQDTPFSIIVYSGSGNSVGASTTVHAVAPSCSINSFTSSLPTVSSGQNVTLSYSIANCYSNVSLSGGQYSSSAAPVYLVNGIYGGSVTTTVGLTQSTTFTLTATGFNGATTSQSVTVSVMNQNPTATLSFITTSLPAATVGQSYSQSALFNYTGTSLLSLNNVFLPAGLSATVNNTGTRAVLITGTPTTPSTSASNVSFIITDGTISQLRTYNLTINPGTTGTSNCNITSFTVTPATIASGKSTDLQFGALGCVTMTLSGGEFTNRGFPVSAGLLTTSPLTQNTTYTLTGTDSSGSVVTKQVSVVVTAPTNSPLAITPVLPAATVGQPYSTTVQVTGGTAPYNLNFLSTTYPTGCCVLGLSGNLIVPASTYTFNTQTSQTVSGPAGTYTWNYQITDAAGITATKSFSLTINPAATTTPGFNFTTTTLPAATVGQAYTVDINYSYNGTGTPYYFNPALPGGLSTSNVTMVTATNGQKSIHIVGVPTSASSSLNNLTFSMSDGSGTIVNKTFTLLVNPAAVSVTCLINVQANPINVVSGQNTTLIYNATNCANVMLNGGEFTNKVLGASGGNVITSTGITKPTAYTFSGASPSGASYSLIFTVGVTTTNTVISFNPTTLPAATVGQTYSQDINIAYTGTGSLLLTNISLPAGLNAAIVTVNGQKILRVSGTPTTATTIGTPSNTNLTVSDNNVSQTIATLLFVNPSQTNPNPNTTVGAAHLDGTNVLSGYVVYYVSNGQKRAYTSAGAFLSYGFNYWSDVQPATSGDLALPDGSFVPPMDGTLVNDKGTLYIITAGKRQGFANSQAFTDLGYSFANQIPGDTSFMQTLAPINSANIAHPQGTLINDSGTIFLVTCNGKTGLASANAFSSWGYNFRQVVGSNSYDNTLPLAGILNLRKSGAIDPSAGYCS